MKIKLLILLFLLPLCGLIAQETVEIQQGNLRAYLRANGGLTNPTDIHWLSYVTEQGQVPLAHYSGLWMGGIDPSDNLFIADLRDGGSPGPAGTPTPFDKVWKVTADEINSHIADFEDNGVIDNPIPAIYSWPGRDNPFFEDYNEGLQLPTNQLSLLLLAPFWDKDGDGIYNPEDGDYPILEIIRGCMSSQIVPSEMNWCIFTVTNDIGGTPVFEVSLNLFTFGCEELHPLNDAIFASYKLINISETTYNDMYLGSFTDPDLGCPFDDYIGSFPERAVAYVYNADNEDENCFAGLNTFGTNPPVFGVDVYRGPLSPQPDTIFELGRSSIMAFSNPSFGNPTPGTTDPGNGMEYYNYLQGKWRDSSPLTVGNNGYGGSETTEFAFPGLPQASGNWTEFQANNTPGDRRFLINYGPFTLQPGAVNEFIMSYSVYNGPGNHLEKVEGFRDQGDQLQAYFDFCFDVENAVGLPPCNLIMTDTEHKSLTKADLRLFPNPASDQVTIDTDEAIDNVWLLNAAGQQVWTGSGNNIQLGHLPTGLYFVGIEIEGRTVFRKLVKE